MHGSLALALLLSGCGWLSEDEDVAPPPAAVAPQAPVPVAPSLEDRVAAAKVLALGGDHLAALAAVEALIAEAPQDDVLWRIMQREAVASGRAGELVDRLDADPPLGGRRGRQQVLRAELALQAGRPEVALAAARTALADQSDAAAALMAMSVAAGASFPDVPREPGADIGPVDALVGFARAPDLHTAEPFAAGAAQVAGWRAAVLRAERLREWGQGARSLAEFRTAAGSDDPRGAFAGRVGATRLVLDGQGDGSLEDARTWAEEAARIAIDSADPAGAIEALQLSALADEALLRPAAGLALATQVREALKGAGNKDAAGAAAFVVARLADRAGRPEVVLEAAHEAARAVSGSADGERAAEAGWLEGLAAFTLGDAEALRGAGAGVSGPRQTALDALAMVLDGHRSSAAAALSTEGLEPADVARVAMIAAWVDPAVAHRWLERAVHASDEAGDPVLRVQTRLALEEHLRESGARSARHFRSELLKLAAEGSPGDGLRAEVAARGLLAGEAVSFPATLPPPWQAWASLAAGQAPQAGLDSAPAAGVARWAAARAAIAAHDVSAIGAALDATEALPVHRQGMLSTGTALDGSEGLPFAPDLVALEGWTDEVAVGCALAAHEVRHRRGRISNDLAMGRDLTAGADTQAARALRASTAEVRAGMALYLAGSGALPADAFLHLAQAEETASEQDGFAKLLPARAPGFADVRALASGAAVLSIDLGPQRVTGVVVTPNGGRVLDLGPTRDASRLIADQWDELRQAASAGRKADHMPGHRLRVALLDPFADELTGFGRYLLLVPQPLLEFPFTTLPEQATGLRYLADIRSMGVASSLQSLGTRRAPPEVYKPDLLGIANPAPASSEEQPADVQKRRKSELLPLDLGAARNHFGSNFRQVLLGSEATLEAWRAAAPTARTIFISKVPAAPDGGFLLGDGELSVEDLRATPLTAELAIIMAKAPGPQQVYRARALLDAGVQSVLVASWPMPERPASRVTDGFFEALNRDRGPARALGEARESLLNDRLLEIERNDPALWGALVLYSAP